MPPSQRAGAGALEPRALLKELMGFLPWPMSAGVLHLARLAVHRDYRRRYAATRRALARLGNPAFVLEGPFAGMRVPPSFAGSQGGHFPKVLGSYEMELHDVIRELIRAAPRLVVDVGAAEGYYVIGLARAIPHCRVVGFESERAYRKGIDRLARANAVHDRVESRGACTAGRLEDALDGAGACWLIMDCEGMEGDLLDPTLVPSLRTTSIVVETHETIVPGVTSRIVSRFEGTHDVAVIWSQPRGGVPATWASGGGAMDDTLALDEGRTGPMSWLVLRPRTPQCP